MQIKDKPDRWKAAWWVLAALILLGAPLAKAYVLMGAQVLERMAEILKMPACSHSIRNAVLSPNFAVTVTLTVLS